MEKGQFFSLKLKLEWESFEQRYWKENFKKDVMNLTETDHQICILFQAILGLNVTWLLRVWTYS